MRNLNVLILTIVLGLNAWIDNKVYSYSMDKLDFHLVKNGCFNRSKITGEPLKLGQNEPVGMSIENLISLLERFELLNPRINPETVIRLFLKRFHLDNLEYDGQENIQTPDAYHQALVTGVLLKDEMSYNLEPFPEYQFTEDEKCNLFFTISHTVNQTATADEDFSNLILKEIPRTRVQADPFEVKPIRNKGTEVPIPKKTPPSPLETTTTATKFQQERRIRSISTRKTKRPREYGVASFLGSKTNPISVNRVLMGMYVGFRNPEIKTIGKIVKELSSLAPIVNDKFINEPIDPLLAVTLANIYGINVYGMVYQQSDIIFGADGRWNNTICHTDFILDSNEGILATLAEFRGGLDGYNIGKGLKSLLANNHKITASQALRFYYSKQGLLPNSGICVREASIDDLQDDLVTESRKYLEIWNNFYHTGQFTQSKMDGYINSIKDYVFSMIKKAAALNEEEQSFCNDPIQASINQLPCESDANIIAILDHKQDCKKKICGQALFVKELTNGLNMRRNRGSISIIYNGEFKENPNLVDDQMKPVQTPFFTVLYNSTSSECASCKSIYAETTAINPITDRVILYEQLNKFIEEFDAKYANYTGVPGKIILWYDYGSIESPPNEQIRSIRYDTIKRKLLYGQRDASIFAISTNVDNFKDIITDKNRLVQIKNEQTSFPTDVLAKSMYKTQIESLKKEICKIPQVFQYADCKYRASNNYSHQGLITPNRKQYWMVNPEYFLKTFRMELKFRAEDSLIKVCYDRVSSPEIDEKNCKVNSRIDQELSLVINNPCAGKTFENCPSIYFTISLHNPSSVHKLCTDFACKNIHQRKWYFTHTGMSCNGAFTLQLSSFVVAIMFLLNLINYI